MAAARWGWVAAVLCVGCGNSAEKVEGLSASLTSGTGLRGEYFDHPDLTQLRLVRLDPVVSFDWSTGAPMPEAGAPGFSVRWTGQLVPRFSEHYTLTARVDDGVRLWLDGRLIIDNWSSPRPEVTSSKIKLRAGARHELKLEYYQSTGTAVARLFWASKRQAREIIPSSQLIPSAPVVVDAGTPDAGTPDAGTPDAGTPDAGTPGPQLAGWLRTEGNRFYRADGTVWRARGANVMDTRGCGACMWNTPNPGEVKRRIDELIDGWKANFLRLDLESYASADGRLHYADVLHDPRYLADIEEIVRHVGTKPGVYVLLSLWIDPSIDAMGWPTEATNEVWRKLAYTFRNSPHVLFGIVNEPQSNFSGARDPEVWAAMNRAVTAIREVELAAGTPTHIVAVQGTGGWARRLDYYVTHPITAGGGRNVAYEIHIYDPASELQRMLVEPAATLPIIVGEFGMGTNMTAADCTQLMDLAEQHAIPYLAWAFHMRCAPNLLQDLSGGGCGVGMTLQPTPWGELFKARLAR
jgi:hypothetical protein